MDDNDPLKTVLLVAAGLIVLVAVIAAGYMVFSAVLGSSPPVITPTPVIDTSAPTPVPTTYVVVPSGTFMPTVVPSSGSTTVNPTPVQPQVENAELVGYGTDKDTYNSGDTAMVYITIANTGNVVIDNATLDVAVSKYFSIIGYQNVENPSESLTGLNIQPGQTQNATYDITIPSQYEGLSTAGDYQFKVNVYVWGDNIGNFTKKVTVT